MKVRLVGAGAVGAVVGYRLAGVCDFGLIVDAGRYERYQANPLKVNGDDPRFLLYRPSEAEEVDLVIFATKNFQLSDAMEEAAPFIGDHTVILSLLNGIESEKRLEERFGEGKCLYGFITNLSSNHNGSEITCFSQEGGRIVLGERDNTRSSRLYQVTSLFERAGITFVVPEDILHEQWWKFMLNCCFNSLSAILLTTYSQMYDNAALMRAVRMLASEVLLVSRSEGVVLGQDDIEHMITLMTGLNDEGKTSMLQDMEAHRQTENRYFCGSVVALGNAHDIPTPIADFVYQLVEAAHYART